MSYQINNISNLTISTGSITNTGTVWGVYTTSGYSSSAGSMTISQGSYNWSTQDVVLKRPSGKEIRVGSILEQITDLLMLIPEDKGLLDKNPALKAAYDHHQSLIKETFNNSQLRESYDSYIVLRNLTYSEQEDG